VGTSGLGVGGGRIEAGEGEEAIDGITEYEVGEDMIG